MSVSDSVCNKHKNYFFQLECELSEMGRLKAQIQPMKTIDDIKYKLPKQITIIQTDIVENKNIFFSGVLNAHVETTKLHERLKEVFQILDKECIFKSKWKLLDGIEFDESYE